MDTPIVVKVGGSTLESNACIHDLATLAKRKIPLVIVHGGGNLASRWMGRLDIEPEFVNGIRRTNATVLEVVMATIGGIANQRIVANLRRRGTKVIGTSGVGFADGKSGDPALGLVAESAEIDPEPLFKLLQSGFTVVVAPLVANAQRDCAEPILNMNADIFGGYLARSLHASKVVFLTDTNGVLDANKRTIPHMTRAQAKEIVASGVARTGMVPKLQACITSLETAKQACIIDGREQGSLVACIDGARHGTHLT